MRHARHVGLCVDGTGKKEEEVLTRLIVSAYWNGVGGSGFPRFTGVVVVDDGCVDGSSTISASRSGTVHCTSIFLDLSCPVSASHRCCREWVLSCGGEDRIGGVRRRLGEFRIASEASVTAALGAIGVVLPTAGVAFWEPPLPAR